MSFNYACFISYRHGRFGLKQAFIEEFHYALSSELETLRDQPVYIDLAGLEGGDFYNPALATALYQSACMVLVFQPNYFDAQHPYCALEYHAMLNLERQRLSVLPAHEATHGLIIPVILRGPDALPPELQTTRQYHDFSRYSLTNRRLLRNREYAPKIRQIASYIDTRCSILATHPELFTNPTQFELPTPASIAPWLQQVLSPELPFPSSIRRGGIAP